eukprot:365298-Chlamydomonas_euryale.AAC.6
MDPYTHTSMHADEHAPCSMAHIIFRCRVGIQRVQACTQPHAQHRACAVRTEVCLRVCMEVD